MNEEVKNMAFCPNCGAQLETDTDFCGNCGMKISTFNTVESEINGSNANLNTVNLANKNVISVKVPQLAKIPKQKVKRIATIAAVCVAILAVVIGIISYNASFTKIDMKKAFTVDFKGLNGSARAVVTPDEMYLYKTVMDAMGLKAENLGNLSDVFSGNFDYGSLLSGYSNAMALESLINSIEIECTPSENLSNGDKVEVTISCNEDAFKKQKIKIKNTSFTVKVEDLLDGTEYDLFKDVKLIYNGVSPDISVSVDTMDCDDFVRNYVNFTVAEKSSHYKNGDVITLNATYNENAAEEKLYVIKNLTKEYTISGQTEYLKSFEGIDTAGLQKEVSDHLESFISSNYSSGSYFWGHGRVKSVESKGLQSGWLLNIKENRVSYGSKNSYLSIYKYTVICEDETTDIYVMVRIDSVVKNSDGSLAWGNIRTFSEDDYDTAVSKNITTQKADYDVTEIK